MASKFSHPERPPSFVWLSPAFAALLYPLLLRSAYGSVRLLDQAAGVEEKIGAVFAYVLAIAAAYGVPILAAVNARRLAAMPSSEAEATRAVRILHLVFAAPPLFTALGVYTFILGIGDLEILLWVAFWSGLIALAVSTSPALHGELPARPRSTIRRFHGVIALAVLSIFLIAHLANHVLALWTPELHGQVMKFLEKFYRAEFIEPVLILLVALLLASGLMMAWRYTASPEDGFRTLQTLTGFYIAVFAASHLSAVFVMARWIGHIPTDWAFASGAPAGLIRDPWNVRLITHYSIAVWAVITHVGLGARGVMRAHGMENIADATARFMTALGGAASAAITLALLGVHLGNM